MSKTKFEKLEAASIALFGEEEHYRMAADAKADALDTRFVWNPLVELDLQMMFLETSRSSKAEWAADMVFWVDNALECIEAKGVNYRWSMFEDFQGVFASRPDTPVGAILREMSQVHEFMAWKPYLERIRAIASASLVPGFEPAASGRRSAN